jgi:hypothetical protein
MVLFRLKLAIFSHHPVRFFLRLSVFRLLAFLLVVLFRLKCALFPLFQIPIVFHGTEEAARQFFPLPKTMCSPLQCTT